MKEFFVFKESGTFSDTIECLGLADILQKIFNKIDMINTHEILIEDKGGYFQITSDVDIREIEINKCEFFDFIPYIAKNKKDYNENRDYNPIDYEREKEIRGIKYKNRNDENVHPVRPDYDIIRMFANMEGYRKSFCNARAFKEHFSLLLTSILDFYSHFEANRSDLINIITSNLKSKNISVVKISSLQDINPDKGKGANQPKANGIIPKGQSAFWLSQLIRFTGAWVCFISRYFDKDIKTYALVPKLISTQYLSNIYQKVKPLVRKTESIKMDISLIHLTLIELIKYDANFKDKWNFGTPSDKILGLQLAYYKNLGQRPAVTNIGFIGLPKFVKFNSKEEGLKWIELWKEHKQIIGNINEGNSSNISMLQNYRQFLSASDFNSFFDFQFSYASLIINAKNNPSYKNNKFINEFKLKNMEVLMATNARYVEITRNSGFISIAAAIRNSTIIPIIHKEKKDVIFGLNQKIKIASRSKDALLTEITEFIQKYNEIIMLKDYHDLKHKKYVTTEDIQEFCRLLDETDSPKLVAGMLVAYGYAKEPSKENQKDNNIKGDNNE